MFAALIEVVKDLWDFAVMQHLTQTPGTKQLLLTSEQKPEVSVKKTEAEPISAQPSLESRVCYVSESTLLCLQTPQKKFDTLRGIFSYGDMVRVMQQKNNWSFVEHSDLRGWVYTSGLETDESAVLPRFTKNSTYTAFEENTIKLRAFMQDALLGGELKLPLQSVEYIHYRLKKAGTKPHWPLERPRLPGNWQHILRGKRGVEIGLEPKTGSILECNGCQENEFLAYVESVTPDNTIVISCVGRTQDGVYEEMQYTKAQWQEWKPVFISFT
jgi:hypothetical protein